MSKLLNNITSLAQSARKTVSKFIQPKVYIIGESVELNKELKKQLSSILGIKILVRQTVNELKKKDVFWARALLLVESENCSLQELALGLKRPFKTNVFAVVSDNMDQASERTLYQIGFQMVFEWPREKERISGAIGKIIFHEKNLSESHNIAKEEMDSDEALKSAVRIRLFAETGWWTYNKVLMHVYRGIVMLEGRFQSPEKLQRIVRQITNVPGVRGVLAQKSKSQLKHSS